MGGRSRKPAGADGRGGPAAVLAAYDLAKALHEAVLRFPRVERPGLGADIERACRTVLGGLIEAQMGQEKAASLRAAAVELEKLRFLVRMACDFRHVGVGQYEALSARIDELGRMIGGWLRWAAQPSEPCHDVS